MTNEKAKRKVVAAIRTIVKAAKELVEAESAYSKSNIEQKGDTK